MIRESFPVRPLGCNCTVLGDAGEGIVVDPGGDIPKIVATLEKHGLTLKQIVITHAHFDHIAAAGVLKELTGAPIVYNQLDLPLAAMLSDQPRWVGLQLPLPEKAPTPDADAADGTKVSFGGVEATLLHTPGHTPGSVVLHVPSEKLLLAGDTLFAGSIGRTDFPGGDTRAMMRSLHEVLMKLPEETLVVPGHGECTTIGQEAESNPFL